MRLGPGYQQGKSWADKGRAYYDRTAPGLKEKASAGWSKAQSWSEKAGDYYRENAPRARQAAQEGWQKTSESASRLIDSFQSWRAGFSSR